MSQQLLVQPGQPPQSKDSCCRCGSSKAVGIIETRSPTGRFGRVFAVCIRCIIPIERYLDKVPGYELTRGGPPENVR